MRIYGSTLGAFITSVKEDVFFLSLLFYGDVGPHSTRFKVQQVVTMNVTFAKMEYVLTKCILAGFMHNDT